MTEEKKKKYQADISYTLKAGMKRIKPSTFTESPPGPPPPCWCLAPPYEAHSREVEGYTQGGELGGRTRSLDGLEGGIMF